MTDTNYGDDMLQTIRGVIITDPHFFWHSLEDGFTELEETVNQLYGMCVVLNNRLDPVLNHAPVKVDRDNDTHTLTSPVAERIRKLCEIANECNWRLSGILKRLEL